MAEHPSKRVRDSVAQNTSANDETVLLLARDDAPGVRLGAATNVMGRPGIESELAQSPDRWVRAILAHTHAGSTGGSLRRATQDRLAVDDFYEVRARVAETTNLRDLYDRLLGDEDPRVRGACAANLRTTWADAETLLSDRSWTTRALFVHRGVHFPDAEQLLQAARDRSAGVRYNALFRAGAPKEVAQLLADDPDEDVRARARAVLDGQPTWDPAGEAAAVVERSAAPRPNFEQHP